MVGVAQSDSATSASGKRWQVARCTVAACGVPASRSQGAFLYGDLWNFWYKGLPEETVQFNSTVSDLGSDVMKPAVLGDEYDIVIVADGGWSTLRADYFDSAMPEYAGYQVWRFRVESKDVPGFRAYGEYNNGHLHTILLPVVMDDGRDFIMGGTAIACHESETMKPKGGANRQDTFESSMGESRSIRHTGNGPTSDGPIEVPTREWSSEFYRKMFGHIDGGELCRVMEAAARVGKISPMPQYEFASSKVVNGRVVLLGDAAHMASPRTAAGAHTAVLDAMALFEAFDSAIATMGASTQRSDFNAVIDHALRIYNGPALQRANELFRRSLEVSAAVCAPGWKRRRQ
ncbi:hypothetical protein ACHAXA_000832 [Cyclostephanos tholiformis]|uniref:FAD-binding domain-containing protein n=1 Tax=Cyclostephanos tholiformis TaxID=382380 RepID=A0ABD3RWQ4_9STRA